MMLTLFPHEGNGSATVVRDLATVIAPGVDVSVFYVDVETVHMEHYATHTKVVEDFPVLRTHPKSKKRQRFIAMTRSEIDAYIDGLYQSCLAAVHEHRPDVLHVHHGWLGACVAKRLKDELSISFIVQFHGTELEVREDYQAENPETFAYLDELVRDGLSAASRFAVISPTEQELTERYARDAGLPQPVVMIPNGYDESIFFPQTSDIAVINDKFADRLGGPLDPDRPIVMFVGRFAGFKGIEHLVRAVPHYAATEAQTLLCGDGELRTAMIALSEELGLSDVHFLGLVDHFDDLPGLYNAADVLVVPSEGEPFGLVAIEAMGCGVPVIGSDSGALPYVLGSSSEDRTIGGIVQTTLGLLVPFGDSPAIAEAIRWSLDNQLKTQSGERICAEVNREFSVSKQAERFGDLYRDVATR